MSKGVKTTTEKSKTTSHFLRSLTHTFTEENEHTLKHLSQAASDNLGWTVSSSTLLRAMLVYIEQQPSSWASTELYPFIEQEIAQGRVWGSKKKQ